MAAKALPCLALGCLLGWASAAGAQPATLTSTVTSSSGPGLEVAPVAGVATATDATALSVSRELVGRTGFWGGWGRG